MFISFLSVNFIRFPIEINISSYQVHFNQTHLLRTGIIIQQLLCRVSLKRQVQSSEELKGLTEVQHWTSVIFICMQICDSIKMKKSILFTIHGFGIIQNTVWNKASLTMNWEQFNQVKSNQKNNADFHIACQKDIPQFIPTSFLLKLLAL